MYAQCPDCLTVFSMDAETLAQARGHVVCGHCQARFDALATLSSQLPPEPFQHLSERVASGHPPRVESAVYRPRAEPIFAADTANTVDREGGGFSQQGFSPRFARSTHPRGGGRRWPWLLACLVLLLLLCAQLTWAKRDALVADPIAGPWLRTVCTQLGCHLPLVQDVQHLRLLARDVQAHPSVPGALLISATVRNDAHFDQPWPVVVVTLSDINGKRIAMRRLRPNEYLGDGATLLRGLPAGDSTALVLEVEDPGNKAVAFELGFE
ncbi:zinc-ribbon and DUF3426 domain-containing protein [Dyella subtropica]|uniref:zinc-ribbon and DUF3426 domain-containing protein n=1 Tax=Dyella subtropica TaxID=2992127 RepID=UPI00224F9F8C|nr:zinc-ribbon and DUF3426 domain-containing protein [Dyella subtropica]